jgi:hypothetical protein
VTAQVVWSLNLQNFGTIHQQGVVTPMRTDGGGRGPVNATYHNTPGNPSGSGIGGRPPASGPDNLSASCP